MLGVLLAKDLRRARRNPLPWLINLAVPLCITALIGLAFGGKSDSGALGRIRFAVVDEDQTPLSDFLRGAANQRDGAEYLDPVFMDRQQAMREIMDNKLSAAVIIPTNFMRGYFSGNKAVSLELIKNPAQSIHPAVLEELLGVVTTGLNALSRNFKSEFPEWRKVFEGKSDYRKVAALIERSGQKLETAKDYINPPLVSYEKEGDSRNSNGASAGGSAKKKEASKAAPAFNIFAYLLVGMVGMFLLFLANNGMSDLHRELRLRTFERYHTLHHQVLPFVAGKIVFAVVMLLLCSAIMLGGGGLVFRIHWQQPLELITLTLSYSIFAASLMALLVALMPDERRANALNTIAGMALGLAGGCAFPPQQLPALMREHITPLLPSFWYTDAARRMVTGAGSTGWFPATLELAGVSVVLIGLAAFLFRRRFREGLRS